MENASASAAPAPSAGPSDGQDHTPNGNSAVDQQATERSARGAHSSDSPEPAKSKPKQQAKPVDEDPEWDFGDGQKRKRSEVKKRFSEIQSGAQKAWQERKDFEAKLKARDERLQKLGFDADAFEKDPDSELERVAQAVLARKLEQATRDPRELAAEQAQRERDEYKRQLDEHNEKIRKQEYQKEVDNNADQIAGHIATAMQEHGLPPNGPAAWLMLNMLRAARKGNQSVSLASLAAQTNKTINAFIDHGIPANDGKAIADRLGPERVEALRKHILAEHQSKFQPQTQTQQRQASPKVLTSNRHPNGYITFDEMLAASKRR